MLHVSYQSDIMEEFSVQEQVRIADEFTRLKDSHYLDNAGTALYGENQIKQIANVLSTTFLCNPHTSKSTENIVDQVRFR